MTTSIGIRLILVVVALTGIGAAVSAFHLSLSPPTASVTTAPTPSAEIAMGPAARPDSLVVARDVFRPDRHPAPIAYEPAPVDEGPRPPVEPLPSLSLAGVVLGRSRAALLRGIPGVDGVRVLGEGEGVGEVRVLRVSDGAAVVLWRADTLRLTLPRGGS